MTKNNTPTVIDEPLSDMTDQELDKVKSYVDAGLPGVVLEEAKLTNVLDLYLSGKTYNQIARITRIDKTVILYHSYKYNWFQMRKDYVTELEYTIQNRMIESKIVNQDFLLQLVHMWQKKIGAKINDYLASGDEKHANAIDLKEIDKYLKTVETLHRLSGGTDGKPGTPAVGLNLGDGVTISKGADGTVEITPKQTRISDMIKNMAEAKRLEEIENNNNKKPK